MGALIPVLFVVLWVAPIAVTILKGKLLLGAISLALPMIAWVAACRLARPEARHGRGCVTSGSLNSWIDHERYAKDRCALATAATLVPRSDFRLRGPRAVRRLEARNLRRPVGHRVQVQLTNLLGLTSHVLRSPGLGADRLGTATSTVPLEMTSECGRMRSPPLRMTAGTTGTPACIAMWNAPS